MKNTLLPLVLLSTMIGFPLAKADDQVQVPTQATTPAPVLDEQTLYYINSNSVRVRSAGDGTGKILGELSLNDRIKVINPGTIYGGKFVEVVIALTYDPI